MDGQCVHNSQAVAVHGKPIVIYIFKSKRQCATFVISIF